MSTSPPSKDSATAEAAMWLVKLQSGAPDAEQELAFREWLDRDPSHHAAFARGTEVWEALGGAGGRYRRRERRRVAVVAGALILACAASVQGLYLARHPDAPMIAYESGHGHQRKLMLGDGTRLTLNADSSVRVRYSDAQRQLFLDRGEVLFEVAKDSSRPFIVESLGHQVQAVGTVFDVAQAALDLRVTLLEGRVRIGKPSTLLSTALGASGDQTLVPGEQWSLAQKSIARLSPTALEQATAWLHRELVLSNTRLADAAAQMNRYGPVPIEVDANLADLRVSGIFALDAGESFVNTVAKIYGLDVVRDQGRMKLLPRAPSGDQELNAPIR